MTNRLVALVFASILLVFLASQIHASSLPLDKIKLPPGFTITVYTDNVPNARGMALGKNGTLFVGSRSKGDVYAVVDTDGDQRADKVYTIASRLQQPVGVAYRNGSLYVSAMYRILRFDDIEQQRAGFLQRRCMDGNLSPSVRMANSMCPSELPATSVNLIRTAMP